MLHVSDSGMIQLNRGDSFKLPLIINCGTALEPIQYLLADNDIIYFAVLEPNTLFENAIIRKKYTNRDELDDNGNLYIRLSPKDTENLLPGKYYYTIKMQTMLNDGDYDVQTIVPETELQLMR